MYCFYADDGRVLTPPKELEPLLKGSFLAFQKVLGHIRFFYVADEIWDGKSSLVFQANRQQLAAVTLDDGFFHIHLDGEMFQIKNDTLLEKLFQRFKGANVHFLRPFHQLGANPDPDGFVCGYRCDLCLGYQCHNKNEFSEKDNFVYFNWLCYHGCVPGIEIEKPPAGDQGVFRCSGCNRKRNKFCGSYSCSKEKEFGNCAECGEYDRCNIYQDSHYAAQCNLGITAEEITKLVIPYCMKERLDTIRNQIE